MTKLVTLTAAAALSLAASAALADGHRGNSDNAQTMADTLSGSPGVGSAAAGLSGNRNDTKGDSGWGNIGSRATGDPDEGQVSKNGKGRNK